MKFAGREISLGNLLHRGGPNPQIRERLDKIAASKNSAGSGGAGDLPLETPVSPVSTPDTDPASAIEREIESISGQIADGNASTKDQDANRIEKLRRKLVILQDGVGQPTEPISSGEKAA